MGWETDPRWVLDSEKHHKAPNEVEVLLGSFRHWPHRRHHRHKDLDDQPGRVAILQSDDLEEGAQRVPSGEVVLPFPVAEEYPASKDGKEVVHLVEDHDRSGQRVGHVEGDP